MWLANREIRYHTMLPIYNGQIKKDYWNQVKILFPSLLANSRFFFFFLAPISIGFINAKSSVFFTQTVTADWSYLFIYLLFSKSCFTAVLIIIIVHHWGRFLICFNRQYFDTFKLYRESITMVCHELILIKKSFNDAKTWRSIVRLNK